MESSHKFQRTFLMFKQEDTGYGAGQAPSGYVKIEARDGRGKLTAVVQNLKEGKDQFSYNLYILKHGDGGVTPVNIGRIPLNKNNGEIKWDFNVENVAGTGYRIEEFKTAVVLVEYMNAENHDIICPLAAYKDKNTAWRSRMKQALYHEKKQNRDEEEIIKKEDITSKYTGRIESKYVPEENAPELNIAKVSADNSPQEDKKTEMNDSNEETVGNARSPEADHADAPITDEENMANEPSESQELNVGRQNKETGCMFSDNSFCAMQSYSKGVNPCENCLMSNMVKGEEERTWTSGDMAKFKKSLDELFEVHDPFGSRRRDYKWWKVNNPVYLNNVLYQSNIKTPLLFNPAVIMAHFKYRYLIVGVYTDRVRRREYIVCGIPGAYQVDGRPFGDMCRWVQMEGSRPKYGAFGYWLVYIDPRTGKFLKLNQ